MRDGVRQRKSDGGGDERGEHGVSLTEIIANCTVTTCQLRCVDTCQ